jgi:hypothetical protein
LNERRAKCDKSDCKTNSPRAIEVDTNVETKVTPIVLVDKSAINLDISRKMATFMDFSVILNKKAPDETNFDLFNKTGLGNIAHELWDVSCIGKNS